MHFSTLPIAAFVIAATVAVNISWSTFHVEGFSTRSPMQHHGSRNPATERKQYNENTKPLEITRLFGILDDIMMEEENREKDAIVENDSDQNDLIDLYHSLIFASDLESEISKRFRDCTDSRFLEYLNSLSESSQDKEEREGLAELVDQIDNVKTAMDKKSAENEEKAATQAEPEPEEQSIDEPTSANKAKPLSNADILRKASEIDAAIALSDDEKPSDFISDCREVVNLSRGFNDSGQMRVGGG